MLRINYLPPEQMPSHQRDFPHEKQLAHLSATDGSRELAFLVVFYLIAQVSPVACVPLTRVAHELGRRRSAERTFRAAE